MQSFLQDIRFAIRVLMKNRGFTAVALLTLCLCIGANTAIFTVLSSVLLNPLPFPESDRLVAFYNCYPGVGVDKISNAAPDYVDRRAAKDAFEEVALMQDRSYNVGSNGSPERVRGLGVTPSFFPLLRVPPLMGRVFTEEEGNPGADKTVILSYSTWQQMFAGDPDVLGRDVRLSGEPYQVVGVMPEGFEAESPSRNLRPGMRLWVPLALSQEQVSDDMRHSNAWQMLGRLQPGVSVAQAQARVDAINLSVMDRIPEMTQLLEDSGFHTLVASLHDEMVLDVRLNLYLLQVAVALVLLIGVVNIANLLVVRASARQREFSLRCALGAGRWRLARQLLTESVLLGAAGGVMGVVVGIAGVRTLAAVGVDYIPRGDQIHVDAGTLWFTLALSLVTGLLFGAAPLIHALTGNLASGIQQTGRSGTTDHSSGATRGILVVAQVALAFVLLIGAGLMIASLARVLGVEPGFRPERVLTAFVSLPSVRYGDDLARAGFAERALDRARALPGVTQAGLTDYLPFTGIENSTAISVEGYQLAPGEPPPVPAWARVTRDYFRTMSIPLLSGRTFRESDTADAIPVAIVDEFLAEKYWPGQDPIGHRISDSMEIPEDDDDVSWFTVVGVVGSVHINDLADTSQLGVVYFHYKQHPSKTFALVLQTAGDENQLIGPLRAAILDLDAEQPIFSSISMNQRLEQSFSKRRGTVWLASIFAGLAIFLSALGIYGVLAYSVAQRTPEIGIRMALGASAGTVLWMVVRHGLKLAAIGLAIGAVVALFVTRLIQSLLFDVSAHDPLAFAAAGLGLAAVAVIAAIIPSLRAARIRPMNAIRHE